MEIRDLPLTSLITDQNLRNVNHIADLAASMQSAGQEVEIRVFEMNDGRFLVKAGHRRVEAAKVLGWSTIRAVVEPEPEDEASFFVGMYNENNLRESMDYLTKSMVYERLYNLGMSQKAIADKLGTTQADVSLGMSLARAHPKIQKAVNEGKLSPSAAEPLLPLSYEEQEKLVDVAITEKTVRRVKSVVENHKQSKNSYVVSARVVVDDCDPYDEMVFQALHIADSQLDMVVVSGVQDRQRLQESLEKIQGKINQMWLEFNNGTN